MKRFLLILLIAAPLGAGCYPKADQIAELQERQTALEEKMDNLIGNLQSDQAMLARDVERIENNQLLLAGEIENIQKKNITLRRKIEKVAEDTDPANGKNPDTQAPHPPKDDYILAAESYNKGKFEDAILEYQKFIDTSPKDNRIPGAYLGQGLSLMNLGRKEEAKFFFNTLIDKYPNSKAAKTAKAKLKAIQ
jgi:TolA-binding protein